jgi:hypothetical protein
MTGPVQPPLVPLRGNWVKATAWGPWFWIVEVGFRCAIHL